MCKCESGPSLFIFFILDVLYNWRMANKYPLARLCQRSGVLESIQAEGMTFEYSFHDGQPTPSNNKQCGLCNHIWKSIFKNHCESLRTAVTYICISTDMEFTLCDFFHGRTNT